MKEKLTILLWAALATIAGAAEQPPSALTVAVYDFKGDAAVASYGRSITTLVTADLTTETNLILVERAELTKALNEQAFGTSGMVTADAAAKIGQITGAKILVVGQVLKTGGDRLVIVADIIGTETGRLFAPKVDGAAENLLALTSDLSRKIAQTITEQATNLVLPAEETQADRLDRIIKNITGTNRPAVSVHITQWNRNGNRWPAGSSESEFGTILLKAGFKVVDQKSDDKPDLEITGDVTTSWGEDGPKRGGLISTRASLQVKIQERKTGKIICFEHQESTAVGIGATVGDRISQINAVDALAERVLPLLAK
jgi:TolB-like protein